MITKVLIEGDILIQLGKQLEAEKEGYQLDCFFSVDEFLHSAHKYTNETQIYIGSNLEEMSKFKTEPLSPEY